MMTAAQMEDAIKALQRNSLKEPSRIPSGGSSNRTPRTVLVLPPIPSAGSDRVYWTSDGGGTGDNQDWETRAGQVQWFPVWKFTTLSGVPV